LDENERIRGFGTGREDHGLIRTSSPPWRLQAC
jgi:hypothetical protein